jgi:hypothetical protein
MFESMTFLAIGKKHPAAGLARRRMAYSNRFTYSAQAPQAPSIAPIAGRGIGKKNSAWAPKCSRTPVLLMGTDALIAAAKTGLRNACENYRTALIEHRRA